VGAVKQESEAVKSQKEERIDRRHFLGLDRLKLFRDAGGTESNIVSDTPHRAGHPFPRRVFMKDAAFAAASFMGISLSSCARKEPAGRIEYPTDFRLPARKSFAEIQGEFPTFGEFMKAVAERNLLHRGDIGLAEALLYMAKDSVQYGLTADFDFKKYQEKIHDLAGKMGKALMKSKPQNPEKAVKTLNKVFFSELRPKEREEAGDTATINEVLDAKGGCCEDLVGVCMSCIQLLQRAGIKLPIHPVSAPGHVLVAYDDTLYKNKPKGKGETRFFVDLADKGRIFEDPRPLRNVYGWDPRKSKGYFIARPIELALGAELGNRCATLGMMTPPKVEAALQDAVWAVQLNPTAETYFNIARCYELSTEPESKEKAMKAFERSLELDSTLVMAHKRLADLTFSTVLLAGGSMGDGKAETLLKKAERHYLDALTHPIKDWQRKQAGFAGLQEYSPTGIWIRLGDLNMEHDKRTGGLFHRYVRKAVDYYTRAIGKEVTKESKPLLEKRAAAFEGVYDRSKKIGNLDSSIADWQAIEALGRAESKDLWMEEAYSNQARLHVKRFTDSRDNVCLVKAVAGYSAAIDANQSGVIDDYTFGRGLAYYLKGDLGDAFKDLSKTISETAGDNPNHVKSLILRGMVHTDSGDEDKAREDFKKAVGIYQAHISAKNVAELRNKVGRLDPAHFINKTMDALEILEGNDNAKKLFEEALH
jgi:tetratricopeptide (TPR) repeat protein